MLKWMLAMVLGFGGVVQAEDKPLVATLVASTSCVEKDFLLGVHIRVEPHWHTYWINPGDSGQAAKIVCKSNAGLEFGEAQWPIPEKISIDGGVAYGYEKEVLVIIPVRVAKPVEKDAGVKIEVNLSWMACKESCIEGQEKLSLDLKGGMDAKAENKALFDGYLKQLPGKFDSVQEHGFIKQVVAGAGGKFSIEWKNADVKKVDWYPVATRAVLVEEVKVEPANHAGTLRTNVQYKATVYKPDAVKDNVLAGLVVFEDEKGNRHGAFISTPLGKN